MTPARPRPHVVAAFAAFGLAAGAFLPGDVALFRWLVPPELGLDPWVSALTLEIVVGVWAAVAATARLTGPFGTRGALVRVAVLCGAVAALSVALLTQIPSGSGAGFVLVGLALAGAVAVVALGVFGGLVLALLDATSESVTAEEGLPTAVSLALGLAALEVGLQAACGGPLAVGMVAAAAAGGVALVGRVGVARWPALAALALVLVGGGVEAARWREARAHTRALRGPKCVDLHGEPGAFSLAARAVPGIAYAMATPGPADPAGPDVARVTVLPRDGRPLDEALRAQVDAALAAAVCTDFTFDPRPMIPSSRPRARTPCGSAWP